MNAVTLTGRIANDLEVSTTNNGQSMIRFRLAFDRKKGNEYKPAFINVTAFGLDLDSIQIGKGSLAMVSGELDFFETKEGDTVFTILARGLSAAAKNEKKGEASSNGNSARPAQSRQPARAAAPAYDDEI